jgi:hypothetical protein
VYRPHMDGAWPKSGFTDNTYDYDCSNGNSSSFYTLLIYLNEGKIINLSVLK